MYWNSRKLIFHGLLINCIQFWPNNVYDLKKKDVVFLIKRLAKKIVGLAGSWQVLSELYFFLLCTENCPLFWKFALRTHILPFSLWAVSRYRRQSHWIVLGPALPPITIGAHSGMNQICMQTQVSTAYFQEAGLRLLLQSRQGRSSSDDPVVGSWAAGLQFVKMLEYLCVHCLYLRVMLRGKIFYWMCDSSKLWLTKTQL